MAFVFPLSPLNHPIAVLPSIIAPKTAIHTFLELTPPLPKIPSVNKFLQLTPPSDMSNQGGDKTAMTKEDANRIQAAQDKKQHETGQSDQGFKARAQAAGDKHQNAQVEEENKENKK